MTISFNLILFILYFYIKEIYSQSYVTTPLTSIDLITNQPSDPIEFNYQILNGLSGGNCIFMGSPNIIIANVVNRTLISNNQNEFLVINSNISNNGNFKIVFTDPKLTYDGRNFQCYFEDTNGAPFSSLAIKINIKVSPRIFFLQTYSPTYDGDSLNINCTVISYPLQPIYVLFNNGSTIDHMTLNTTNQIINSLFYTTIIGTITNISKPLWNGVNLKCFTNSSSIFVSTTLPLIILDKVLVTTTPTINIIPYSNYYFGFDLNDYHYGVIIGGTIGSAVFILLVMVNLTLCILKKIEKRNQLKANKRYPGATSVIMNNIEDLNLNRANTESMKSVEIIPNSTIPRSIYTNEPYKNYARSMNNINVNSNAFVDAPSYVSKNGIHSVIERDLSLNPKKLDELQSNRIFV